MLLSIFSIRLSDKLSFVGFSMVFGLAFFKFLLNVSGFFSALTQSGNLFQFSTALTGRIVFLYPSLRIGSWCLLSLLHSLFLRHHFPPPSWHLHVPIDVLYCAPRPYPAFPFYSGVSLVPVFRICLTWGLPPSWLTFLSNTSSYSMCSSYLQPSVLYSVDCTIECRDYYGFFEKIGGAYKNKVG